MEAAQDTTVLVDNAPGQENPALTREVVPAAERPIDIAEDADMHIDEEGRPRFAPAKNVVSAASGLLPETLC